MEYKKGMSKKFMYENILNLDWGSYFKLNGKVDIDFIIDINNALADAGIRFPAYQFSKYAKLTNADVRRLHPIIDIIGLSENKLRLSHSLVREFEISLYDYRVELHENRANIPLDVLEKWIEKSGHGVDKKYHSWVSMNMNIDVEFIETHAHLLCANTVQDYSARGFELPWDLYTKMGLVTKKNKSSIGRSSSLWDAKDDSWYSWD